MGERHNTRPLHALCNVRWLFLLVMLSHWLCFRAYAPPSTYTGPVLTVLRTSGTNTTHQRIIYRCQVTIPIHKIVEDSLTCWKNCTTWTGGGINLTNSSAAFGYATGTAKPTTPSNPLSGINKHTAAGTHPINITAAHSDQYAVYLQTLTA